MNRIIVLILFSIHFLQSPGQKYDGETICFGDTVSVHSHQSMRNIIDSNYSYKVITCRKQSIVGMRFEIGVSKYYYNTKMAEWIGNHGGPNFNLILTIDKFNVGIRFKPWTVNPKTGLVFNNDTLPGYAKLNPVKIDYYLGYSFDFRHNLSVEPYVGFSNTRFSVINEDVLKKTFTIPKAKGFIAGVTGNKYFKIKNHEYVSVFAGVGYAFVDYRKVNKNLDMGYFEWTVGIAYKGFLEKQFLKKVEY
jgi:hypothetical protein